MPNRKSSLIFMTALEHKCKAVLFTYMTIPVRSLIRSSFRYIWKQSVEKFWSVVKSNFTFKRLYHSNLMYLVGLGLWKAGHRRNPEKFTGGGVKNEKGQYIVRRSCFTNKSSPDLTRTEVYLVSLFEHLCFFLLTNLKLCLNDSGNSHSLQQVFFSFILV